ncbi:MAG: Hsp20/alpha crystallin family protein [Chryseobacterium sp.]|uniref:Hsp20/alpha crystallin family protein n=1 Tax=Pedobacter agri TaxID=454586 RepID=A0A9X3IBK3_9SPHI|nr:Hsp20/alpha crystallin family protein [Pedobacter agri]MCX3267505.1 Hsp20/alpha crystallin family protein [Pedobacter agri]MDQ1142775.1 HSP20 family protein [Pedobacter agri]RZJ89208.1 MAG: Hsp20/alpha crystallin family protein [Chryseobacterium sp.]
MTLVKFNPEKKNSTLLPGFNDIFESVLGDTFFADRRTESVPAINILESTEAFQIELAAPGLKKEDFKVVLSREILTISVQKSEQSNPADKIYNRREFNYGAFTRSFNLPESADADRIQANYTDGILKLSLPKREEAKAVARQIEIC